MKYPRLTLMKIIKFGARQTKLMNPAKVMKEFMTTEALFDPFEAPLLAYPIEIALDK